MGDILIVPSNTLAPQPDRIPFINWVNNSTSSWKVVSGSTINISAPAQVNTLSVQISNAIISVVGLNVRNNFTINGIQVIDIQVLQGLKVLKVQQEPKGQQVTQVPRVPKGLKEG